MNPKTWWAGLPERRRTAFNVAWCIFLVFILVIFWSQHNEFVYAAF